PDPHTDRGARRRAATGRARADARRRGVRRGGHRGRELMNGELTGRARLGRRTKELVKHLRADDIAIVDHADIDRIAAEELAASGVRVVVNVAPSSTGRFPNPGPLELVRAGVRLIDAPGAQLFEEVSDGDHLRIEGGAVWRNGTLLTQGVELDEAALQAALD